MSALLHILKKRLQLARPGLSVSPLAPEKPNETWNIFQEMLCPAVAPPQHCRVWRLQSPRRWSSDATAVAVAEHLDVQRHEFAEHCGLSAKELVRSIQRRQFQRKRSLGARQHRAPSVQR